MSALYKQTNQTAQISEKQDGQKNLQLLSYQGSFRRYEKKFLLTPNQDESFHDYLKDVASVDQYGLTTIHNIYYDTQNWYLIRRSLEGPTYKEKLRLRTYGKPTSDSPAFIEIKKKFKNIVYKRRIAMPYTDAVRYLSTGIRGSYHNYTSEQIAREIDWFLFSHPGIRPAMVICYDRVAWAGNIDPDFRVTFDRNIRYRIEDLDLREGADGIPLLKAEEELMEIKIPEAMPLATVRALDRAKIRMTSYSKYGNGFMTMIKNRDANVLQKNQAPASALAYAGL